MQWGVLQAGAAADANLEVAKAGVAALIAQESIQLLMVDVPVPRASQNYEGVVKLMIACSDIGTAHQELVPGFSVCRIWTA